MGVVPSKHTLIKRNQRHPLPLMKNAEGGPKVLLSLCNSLTTTYV